MFQIILTLLFIYLLIRLGIRIYRAIAARRGHGKRLETLLGEGRLSKEVEQVINAQRDWLDELKRAGRKAMRGRPRPRLTAENRKEILDAEIARRNEFLSTCKLGFYQCVFVFLLASVAGLVLETVWMYVSVGLVQSRVGLVWGPFSPLYGVGALILTIVCWNLRKHGARNWQVFLVSAAIGGSLEQITGMAMNDLFHAQSWTYLGLPDAISQWVAWRFLIAWGIIGLLWFHVFMPETLYRIGMPTTHRQTIIAVLLAVFILADVFMTMACFTRKTERDEGIPAANVFEQWMDTHYTDEFIASRFENLVIGHDLAPNG